jgi:uncharacterized OB-fold protein
MAMTLWWTDDAKAAAALQVTPAMSVPAPLTDIKRFDDGLAAAPVFDVDGDEVRLRGSRCTWCRLVAFPARVVCLDCGGVHVPLPLTGRGVLHSATTVANPPQGFDEGFSYLAVDLMEGPRVLAPAIGTGPFATGTVVQAVAATVRDGALGFRFERANDA